MMTSCLFLSRLSTGSSQSAARRTLLSRSSPLFRLEIPHFWPNRLLLPPAPCSARLYHGVSVSQPWHEFCGGIWEPAAGQQHQITASVTSQPPSVRSKLTLVTWNINAASPVPKAGTAALLSHILDTTPEVDVIFLQEVSTLALGVITENRRIQEGWYITDVNRSNWGKQPFATVSLFSKRRFQSRADDNDDRGRLLVLGTAQRIKYQSRYDRDALCCDIQLLGRGVYKDPASRTCCVRLVNVHLDSLASQPSYRPAQLATVASAVKAPEVSAGLIAGDFNPVLPEDQTLVQANGLEDAWTMVHNTTHGDGATWGVGSKGGRHGPRRMDKVAVLGLEVEAIDVVRPGSVEAPQATGPRGSFPWSDHCGLRCTFMLPEQVWTHAFRESQSQNKKN